MNKIIVWVLMMACSYQVLAFKGFMSDYDYSAVLAQKGEWDKANEHIQALLVSNYSSPDIVYDAGVTSFRVKQYEAAAACFEHAAESSAATTSLKEKALYNAGNAHAAVHAWEKAISFYEKVLTLNPENKHAQHNIEKVKELARKEQEKQKQDQEERDNHQNTQQDHSENQESDKQSAENQDPARESKEQESHKKTEKQQSQKSETDNKGRDNSHNEQGQKNSQQENSPDNQQGNGKKQSEGNSSQQPDKQHSNNGSESQASLSPSSSFSQEPSSTPRSSSPQLPHQLSQQRQQHSSQNVPEKSSELKKSEHLVQKPQEEKAGAPEGDLTKDALEQKSKQNASGISHELERPEDRWLAQILAERDKADAQASKQLMKAVMDKQLGGSHDKHSKKRW